MLVKEACRPEDSMLDMVGVSKDIDLKLQAENKSNKNIESQITRYVCDLYVIHIDNHDNGKIRSYHMSLLRCVATLHPPAQKLQFTACMKGPLRVLLKFSLCTEIGTSYRFFVTIFAKKNHLMCSFNPINVISVENYISDEIKTIGL